MTPCRQHTAQAPAATRRAAPASGSNTQLPLDGGGGSDKLRRGSREDSRAGRKHHLRREGHGVGAAAAASAPGSYHRGRRLLAGVVGATSAVLLAVVAPLPGPAVEALDAPGQMLGAAAAQVASRPICVVVP